MMEGRHCRSVARRGMGVGISERAAASTSAISSSVHGCRVMVRTPARHRRKETQTVHIKSNVAGSRMEERIVESIVEAPPEQVYRIYCDCVQDVKFYNGTEYDQN